MKKLLKRPFIYVLLDIILSPFTLIGGIWLRIAKYIGISRLYITRKMLFKIGVFPIVEHYYEPLFRFDRLTHSDDDARTLDIEWNETKQLEILSRFQYSAELAKLPEHEPLDNALSYYYNNGSYSGVDAEYLYSLLRDIQPARIIEIGSGFSTRMMLAAVAENRKQQPSANTEICCIEPYEMPWLEQTGVQVLRKKVESIPLSFFAELNENDILFIDSSHIIRPHGDVLYELFNILPVLKPGVLIHIHDIFTPFDYPARWTKEEFRMWNEQYILEALLMNSAKYKIIGALSFIGAKYPALIAEKFPFAANTGKLRGSAMWIRKTA